MHFLYLQDLKGAIDRVYQMGRNSCDCWAQDREGFIGKEAEEESHQESDFYLCPLLYWVQKFIVCGDKKLSHSFGHQKIFQVWGVEEVRMHLNDLILGTWI